MSEQFQFHSPVSLAINQPTETRKIGRRRDCLTLTLLTRKIDATKFPYFDTKNRRETYRTLIVRKNSRGPTREQKRVTHKMTTANPTTDDSIEFSEREQFLTAAEYYTDEQPDPADLDDRRDGPPLAKTIVWFDQATPLFCCLSCHEHVRPLKHAGDGWVDAPGVVRGRAYERLMHSDPGEHPRCMACSGDLTDLLRANR